MKTILLLSGPLAVGKTSVRECLLAKHQFQNIRSSEYLRALASANGAASDRRGLQELGDRLDRDTDYRWLLDKVAIPLIEASPNIDRWLVDAVRKELQVKHFRVAFGKMVVHVHLDAAEDVLNQRYEERERASGTFVSGAYAKAIDHDNERHSRALKDIANTAIRTDTNSLAEVVAKILESIELKS